MDAQSQVRDRVFSILNDNDCPSFVIRQRETFASIRKTQPPQSPKQERPNLTRNGHYTRTSSVSSSSSPPLLRFDSSSSKASNRSMDSTPSPITPAYNYSDPNLMQYDGILRQDLNGYMPSPTTITPFMEQQMMIAPNMAEQYSAKLAPQLPNAQYSILPAPTLGEIAQLPTPAPSNSAANSTSTSNLHSKASPPSNNANTGKKNKYPCPYAQSHNCHATFTTSGHAARHGKKHTGEKGVHCPVCNKAFTRKDNMKQHERTHKSSVSGSNSDDSASRRSKAAMTRDLQKSKQSKNRDSANPDSTRKSSVIHSPLSEVTSLAPTTTGSLQIDEQNFYPEPSNQMMIPQQTIPETVSPTSMYPPLGDDNLLSNVSNGLPPMQIDKAGDLGLGLQLPPTLIRGFSDLDTLAQAAVSFDPYYQQNM